jgi:hypothetical protein
VSTPVSHRGYEITAYPARAITPDILYLHVGEHIPAAAAQTAAGLWQVFLYDAGEDSIIVPDEAAARERLETYGWEIAA